MLSPRGQSGLWPKWPRGQNFGLCLCLGLGLGLKHLASAWPRSRSYYVIGHFWGKNRVKFGDFVNFSGNNLKSYVVNYYFWPRPWPQPPEIGLGLGLSLEVLALFNITAVCSNEGSRVSSSE